MWGPGNFFSPCLSRVVWEGWPLGRMWLFVSWRLHSNLCDSLCPPHTPIWEMDTREFIHNQYHIRLNICGVLKQRGALPTFSIRSKNRESALAATWVTDSVRRLLVTLLRPATRVCSKSRGVTPGDAGLLSHVSWIGPVSALRAGPAAPRSSSRGPRSAPVISRLFEDAHFPEDPCLAPTGAARDAALLEFRPRGCPSPALGRQVRKA